MPSDGRSVPTGFDGCGQLAAPRQLRHVFQFILFHQLFGEYRPTDQPVLASADFKDHFGGVKLVAAVSL